ncbi:unnamed protein product [marine sediment metagenome]|uniref:Uncharacterized protein n=1 Tax=marine sediment metagenome TaxID=412755 RepID=X1L6J9_9ZZZZ
MPLTDEWIKEQLALCEKATPGSWAYRKGLGCKDIGPRTGVRSIYGVVYTSGLSNETEDKANAQLCAAAHEGYPLVLMELLDFHASFTLYSKAVRAGEQLCLEAHPELGDLTYPDTGKVVAWLAEEVQRLRQRRCTNCEFYAYYDGPLCGFSVDTDETFLWHHDPNTWYCADWKSREEVTDASI